MKNFTLSLIFAGAQALLLPHEITVAEQDRELLYETLDDFAYEERIPVTSEQIYEFMDWASTRNKTYESMKEFVERMRLWVHSDFTIRYLNAGESSAKYAHNFTSDLDEFEV
jgi:C1A family cysteine protease